MNKSRFLLIMQREYYSIVAKKSFIVSTLLVPLLVLCIGVVPVVLSELSSADVPGGRCRRDGPLWKGAER